MKEFLKKYKFWIIAFAVFAVGLILDLVLKAVFFEQEFDLINGFISIYYTFNTGAAWSIFANQTIFLIVVSVIILIALTIFCLFYKSSSTFYAISVGLIFGGAIGNLIDRILFGGVRDFIRLEFWPTFPIFNIADICLCVGAVMLCVFFLFFSSKLEKRTKKIQNETDKETQD